MCYYKVINANFAFIPLVLLLLIQILDKLKPSKRSLKVNLLCLWYLIKCHKFDPLEKFSYHSLI